MRHGVTSDPYDVTAKAQGNPAREEIRLMLRLLLAERFKLADRAPLQVLVVDRIERPTED